MSKPQTNSTNYFSSPHTNLLLLLLSTFPKMPLSSSVNLAVPTTPLLSFLTLLQSDALLSFGPTDFDPKLYVDLPLSRSLSSVKSTFDLLPRDHSGRVPSTALKNFISECFGDAGSDLVDHDPTDFAPHPEGFLGNVENGEVMKWALEVHRLWRNLSRRVSGEVLADPDLHTLLPLPDPVVVPGSRFREVYYWDTYWIIRGLLVSKMADSAKSLVRNLISMIDVYGFVLNGARAYYSNRSQPPLLSAMIMEIYKKTGDLALVNESLPWLLKEHTFWSSGIHNVIIKDLQGNKHCLSRYYAMWDKPRPESATIDEEAASTISSSVEKGRFYREVASTAESGWDFSSRWMRNASDFTTLSTTSILPVDLNVYVYMMEQDISFFARITGDESVSEHFLKASKARLKAIKTIFWNDEMEQWLDYWLDSKHSSEKVHHFDICNQNHKIYASNFIPLWIQEISSDDATVEKVLKSFQKSGLLYPAGIATTLLNTSQQWLVMERIQDISLFPQSIDRNLSNKLIILLVRDFPNGWPPLQHMIAEGFMKSNCLEAKSLAKDIATRWLRTNYVAFKKTGAMQEKYDVEACGKAGGGGEYKIQAMIDISVQKLNYMLLPLYDLYL